MATEKLTYKKAEELLQKGEYIKLPDWGGFWFKDKKSNKVMVLTKDGEVLDTPHNEYKSKRSWETTKPTKDQLDIIDKYYDSLGVKEEKDILKKTESKESSNDNTPSKIKPKRQWVSDSKLLKKVEDRRQGVRRVENGKLIGGTEFYGELK